MHENRIETVEQLLESKFEVITDDAFAARNNNRYSKMLSTAKIVKTLNMTDYHKEIGRQHYVFIRICEIIKYSLNASMLNGRKQSDYYYMLPEQLIWSYIKLEASYLNPFIERLQYFMD